MYRVFDIYIHHGYALIKPFPDPSVEGGWKSITVDRWLNETRTDRLNATSTLNYALGALVEKGYDLIVISEAGPNYQQLLESVLNRSIPTTRAPTQIPEGFAEVQAHTQTNDQGHYLVIVRPKATTAA